MNRQFSKEIFDIDSQIADDLFRKLEFLCESPLDETTEMIIERLFNDAKEKTFAKYEEEPIYVTDSPDIIDLTGKIFNSAL